ncbi:MAG TPA: iron-sulfur cluster assembly scaffold protein [Rhizomicrobium sp.]
MSDDSLYRKDLLRLAADATGAGRLAAPDAVGDAYNPVCGDRVSVEMTIRDERVAALAHRTQACVLAQASAGLLAEAAIGMDAPALAALATSVRNMLKGEAPPPHPGYAVFDGVAAHPNRHKCVLLPIEAALAALSAIRKSDSSVDEPDFR